MTRLMTRALSLLFALLLAACTATPQRSNAEISWLPVEKQGILRLLTKDLDVDPSALQAIETCLTKTKQESVPEDTLWFIEGWTLPYPVALTGRGERIHTLLIAAPAALFQEGADKAALDGLSNLFEALYPAWPEARGWPEQSARRILKEIANNEGAPRGIPDGPVIDMSRDGIKSATLGATSVIHFIVTVRDLATQPEPRRTQLCE